MRSCCHKIQNYLELSICWVDIGEHYSDKAAFLKNTHFREGEGSGRRWELIKMHILKTPFIGIYECFSGLVCNNMGALMPHGQDKLSFCV